MYLTTKPPQAVSYLEAEHELASMVMSMTSDYPLFLPLCTVEGRMTHEVLAAHLGMNPDVVHAWGVLGRDMIMSRAIERGLLPRNQHPEGATIAQFLRWMSVKLAAHWTCLLTDRERIERKHVLKLANILIHRNGVNR